MNPESRNIRGRNEVLKNAILVELRNALLEYATPE